jgi:hypothetical protein
MAMEKTSVNHRRVWDLSPDKFCFPDYLEFQKDLKDQFGQLRKAGITERDLTEAWEKCGVMGINFTSDTYRMGRSWATIEGFRKECPRDDGCNGVPDEWKKRYGTDAGYWIEFQKKDASEIREAVKQLAKKYPDSWGIKIKPKEFYRVLFFHEIAHTLPICGRFLNELMVMEVEERVKFEQEAWVWAVRMARQKDPKIRILYRSIKKEDKLEHSNFCQWYPLLKKDEEVRSRQKAEAMMKKAA